VPRVDSCSFKPQIYLEQALSTLSMGIVIHSNTHALIANVIGYMRCFEVQIIGYSKWVAAKIGAW